MKTDQKEMKMELTNLAKDGTTLVSRRKSPNRGSLFK